MKTLTISMALLAILVLSCQPTAEPEKPTVPPQAEPVPEWPSLIVSPNDLSEKPQAVRYLSIQTETYEVFQEYLQETGIEDSNLIINPARAWIFFPSNTQEGQYLIQPPTGIFPSDFKQMSRVDGRIQFDAGIPKRLPPCEEPRFAPLCDYIWNDTPAEPRGEAVRDQPCESGLTVEPALQIACDNRDGCANAAESCLLRYRRIELLDDPGRASTLRSASRFVLIAQCGCVCE